LSYGQDRRWKRRLIDLASPQPGARALDLATGTGDIAYALADRGARVVGLDITLRMIELARHKSARRRALPFVQGDMLALPFPSASFDLVTTGYGLRNVPDLSTAIDEIGRVLAPGGQVLSLDFNRPANRVVRGAYLAYLTVVGATLGWMLHRDPDTYRYIPASIRQYPGAEAVARLFEARGFQRVRCHAVLGGLMTIHHAIRT
jgi:demethylmenaquinone methyltransferase/2-methoxy-6-polyprenyl-1,4-benzoquinol methylase